MWKLDKDIDVNKKTSIVFYTLLLFPKERALGSSLESFTAFVHLGLAGCSCLRQVSQENLQRK